MKIKWWKVAVFTLLIEIVSISTLFLMIALSGPHDSYASQEPATLKGFWTGGILSFILIILFAYYLTRKLSAEFIKNGLYFGFAAAFLDVLVLIIGDSDFRMVFIYSNLAKPFAGIIGGYLASLQNKKDD